MKKWPKLFELLFIQCTTWWKEISSAVLEFLWSGILFVHNYSNKHCIKTKELIQGWHLLALLSRMYRLFEGSSYSGVMLIWVNIVALAFNPGFKFIARDLWVAPSTVFNFFFSFQLSEQKYFTLSFEEGDPFILPPSKPVVPLTEIKFNCNPNATWSDAKGSKVPYPPKLTYNNMSTDLLVVCTKLNNLRKPMLPWPKLLGNRWQNETFSFSPLPPASMLLKWFMVFTINIDWGSLGGEGGGDWNSL